MATTKERCFIAIVAFDPGSQNGAFAVFENGEFLECGELPTTPMTATDKKPQINAALLAEVLGNLPHRERLLAVVERVNPNPKFGASNFNFGASFGIIIGVLGALKIPCVMVPAVRWKKALGLIKQNKDASRTMAMQLYPLCAPFLTLKKHHNRADAILIGHYFAKR